MQATTATAETNPVTIADDSKENMNNTGDSKSDDEKAESADEKSPNKRSAEEANEMEVSPPSSLEKKAKTDMTEDMASEIVDDGKVAEKLDVSE